MRKTCPSATLSNTDFTYAGQKQNPGLHGEKPAINSLYYSMAMMSYRPEVIYVQAYHEYDYSGTWYSNHNSYFLFVEETETLSSNPLELVSHGKGDEMYLLGETTKF